MRQDRAVFGTGEWAQFTTNIITGCKHDCKYCYAKSMAIRFGRKSKTDWKDEVVNKVKCEGRVSRKGGRVMYPSTHDIYPDNLAYHLDFLTKLLQAHDEILIVTKPHLECVKAICDKFQSEKARILFRFTIGSADNEVLKYWEEGAPTFEERLESLRWAFKQGFRTSVSCEPMLDRNIGKVITAVSRYVTDTIWLGKANMLIARLKINGVADVSRAKQLQEWQNDDAIKALYETYKNVSIIKWKESIKKVVGLEIPTVKGKDI